MLNIRFKIGKRKKDDKEEKMNLENCPQIRKFQFQFLRGVWSSKLKTQKLKRSKKRRKENAELENNTQIIKLQFHDLRFYFTKKHPLLQNCEL